MHYYLDVIKKYVVFQGRAARKEYWMFALFNGIINLLLMLLGALVSFPFLSFIYGLAVLLPSLALASRRLHDTGRTAWWILIVLIPILGPFVLLAFAVLDSQAGENKYGPNPKGVMTATKGVNPFLVIVIVIFAIALIMAFISAIGFFFILKNSALQKALSQADNQAPLVVDQSNPVSDNVTETVSPTKATPSATPSATSNVNPNYFHSTVGGFSVDFQGQPVQSSQAKNSVGGPYTMYSFEKKVTPEFVLILGYADFPAQVDVSSDPTKSLTASMNSAAQGAGGTVVSSHIGTYKGYPSNDYLIYISALNVYGKVRTILNGQKVYLLEATYPKDQNSDQSSASADSFFNSFSLDSQ
jgi:uncharacterized membrane protein YhaH (DUF805 family)